MPGQNKPEAFGKLFSTINISALTAEEYTRDEC
jgi:hypothetical protein